LRERKARLAALIGAGAGWLRYLDHHEGDGPAIYQAACRLGVEGIVSKPADAPYLPGDRRAWLKVKCLNREEFVVVGWSEPEGHRHRLGSLLLGYYDGAGELIYAGRAGTGFSDAELERVWQRLQPLAIDHMPLTKPPPTASRFGRPLALSRAHWVRPELVAEVAYMTWTADGLLRHVTYLGLRDDKPAVEVRR
jgi:ATP-dependent DNA ligase